MAAAALVVAGPAAAHGGMGHGMQAPGLAADTAPEGSPASFFRWGAGAQCCTVLPACVLPPTPTFPAHTPALEGSPASFFRWGTGGKM